MTDLSNVQPNAQVVSSDGGLIGVVDAVEGGERIRLKTQSDATNATHDFIPSSWVSDVQNDTVRLDRTVAQAQASINDDIPAGDETS